MKILIVLFLMFFSFYLTAKAGPDTTFTADLNGDGKSDNVSIKVYKDAKIKYGSGIYTLKVNNASYSDTAYFEENAFLKLVNLDKKDDFKELALIYWVDPEQNCDLFRYDGKSIIKIGSLSTMSDEFEFPGNGTIKISDWMGFWLAEAVCTYDESSKRFKEKYKDEPADNPGFGNPMKPLYILFTSGSTGKPKGVPVLQRSTVNLVNSFSKLLKIEFSNNPGV